MEADRDLNLEDARTIGHGLWRIAQLAQDAAESLDARVENEDLDGLAEAVEVREALERLQTINIEVSEERDAYQNRHARQAWLAGFHIVVNVSNHKISRAKVSCLAYRGTFRRASRPELVK